MRGEITYEFTRDVAAAASRRFIWRRAGRPLILFGVVFAIGLFLLFASAFESWTPAVVLLGAPLLVIVGWWVYHRRAIAIVQSLPDNQITVRFEPETITFQTSEQTSVVKWSRIKRVWCFPEVLLLFTYDVNNGYTLLPTAPLGEELKRFFIEKVKEHGGKVE